MISQIFFLSARGDTIINRDFRSDLIKNTPELFYRQVKLCHGDMEPIFNIEGINFAYLKKASIYVVATTRFNVSPAYILELLNRIVVIIKDFCGQINEESIRRNFVLVYEILDEIIDFGHPQLTNSSHIKPLIASEVVPIKSSSLLDIKKLSNFSIFTPNTVPSSASSAPIGKASDNSIYLDIFEKINMLFNSSGYVINSSVDGCIQMKSYLSPGASLKLVLNKNVKMADSKLPGSVILDDCNFHDAVDHEDFAMNRALKIVPPQGQFILMNYRITSEFNPPFKVYAFFEVENPYKLIFTIKLKSAYPKENVASSVSVRFNVPKKVSGVNTEIVKNGGNQSADYSEAASAVEWAISKMPGDCEYVLMTKISLPQATASQAQRETGPVTLSFQICMYSISGLQIGSLDDLRMGQQPMNKYIRYVTKSSSYVCRI